MWVLDSNGGWKGGGGGGEGWIGGRGSQMTAKRFYDKDSRGGVGVSWVYEVTIIFYPSGNGRGRVGTVKEHTAESALCTVSIIIF